jgi:hypothetical protein
MRKLHAAQRALLLVLVAGCPRSEPGDVGPRDASDGPYPDGASFLPPPPVFPDGGVTKVPYDARPVDEAMVQMVCDRYTAAFCAKLKECSQRTFDLNYGTIDRCVSITTRQCHVELTTPGWGGTINSVSACVTSVMSQTCADRVPNCPGTSTNNPIPTPAGTLQVGNPCSQSFQCRSGAYCRVLAGSECGLCFPPLPAGAECVRGDQCVNSTCLTVTNSAGTFGQCVPFKKRGEVCSPVDTCEARTVCVGGQCVDAMPAPPAPPPVGRGEDCSKAACDTRMDIYCNRVTLKCEPLLPLANAGEPCGTLVDGSNGQIQCVAGTTCVGVMGLTRTCVADLALGMACNPTGGARCALPAECVNRACALRDPPVCQ